MNEQNGNTVDAEAITDKRAWQAPTMEVFDVSSLTAGGVLPNPFNPADINLYQS